MKVSSNHWVEKGMIRITLIGLDGEKFDCELFPYDTLREEIRKIQPVKPKNTVLLLYHNGSQIHPDLTIEALGLTDGDVVVFYNKIVKRNFPLPFNFLTFNKDSMNSDYCNEEIKILDKSMNKLESLAGSNAFSRVMLEKLKQRDMEEESLELLSPKTVIKKSNSIQTAPLPVCFEVKNTDIGSEFGLPNANISPLNPLRRNVFQDTSQSH